MGSDISENATNRAYKAIKDMIAQYQLVPEQKIVYEQLAQKIKLSTTPIINALYRLEQEEFVSYVPNRGFIVKSIGVEEVIELFEVREALERQMIVSSIKNQNALMMNNIEKAMIAHRENHHNVVTRKRQASDASFHLKIAEMSGNKSLTRILRHVFEHIYFRHRNEIIQPERLDSAEVEHQKIFDAIKDKNIGEAMKLVVEHVRAAKFSTLDGIQKTSEEIGF